MLFCFLQTLDSRAQRRPLDGSATHDEANMNKGPHRKPAPAENHTYFIPCTHQKKQRPETDKRARARLFGPGAAPHWSHADPTDCACSGCSLQTRHGTCDGLVQQSTDPSTQASKADGVDGQDGALGLSAARHRRRRIIPRQKRGPMMHIMCCWPHIRGYSGMQHSDLPSTPATLHGQSNQSKPSRSQDNQ